MGEAIDHALREEQAFLRPFVTLQKDVVVRGRDPATLKDVQSVISLPLSYKCNEL